MNKIATRILAFILAVLLCFTCGCSGSKKVEIEPMEPEKPYSLGYDFLGGIDVMPISAFYGPNPQNWSFEGNVRPNQINDEVMSLIHEAGINHLSNIEWNLAYDNNASLKKKLLELGEKYGVAIAIGLGRTDDDKFDDESLAQYKKYPAFTTVYIADEPSGLEYFADPNNEIAVLVQPYFEILNKLGYQGYCNLFPLYDMNQEKKYIDYIERFMDLCNPPVLMWDHYPFDNNTYDDSYFGNMSICRVIADREKTPWWAFMRVGRNEGEPYVTPTEFQLHWNVNTSLAYGAKGIQYYTLSSLYTITDNFDTFTDKMDREGIIGVFGGKTHRYDTVKEINKQIAAVDHVLMNSVNKGILTNGKNITSMFNYSEHILKGQSWRELKDFDGETMVGCFNYNGKSAFYVVNGSFDYAQHITLDFHNKYKLSVIQKAEETLYETDSLTLDMKAGEGALIVIE